MNPHFKHKLWKWIGLWGMLVIGYLSGIMAFFGARAFRITSFADVLGIAIFPLLALATAVIGPLSIVCFALYLFRVQGGTPVAVCSLTLGTLLIYGALIWCVRLWAKAESPLARWLGRIGALCYSTLSTYCLLYIVSHM